MVKIPLEIEAAQNLQSVRQHLGREFIAETLMVGAPMHATD